MPIEIQLMREGRVIVEIFTDPLDMDDIVQNLKNHHEILDRSDKPIHSITDTTGLTRLPSNVLGNSRRSFATAHPLAGVNVVVTSNAFFKVVAELFIKVVPHYKIKIYKTMNEGWAEIDRILAEEQEQLNSKTS